MSASLSLNRRVFLALSVIAAVVSAMVCGGTVAAQQLKDGSYKALSVQVGADEPYSVSPSGEWLIRGTSEDIADTDSGEILFSTTLDFSDTASLAVLGPILGQNSGVIIVHGNAVDLGGLSFVPNLQVEAPIYAQQYFQFHGAAVYGENEFGLLVSVLDLNSNEFPQLRKRAEECKFMTDGWDGRSLEEIDSIVKARLRPNWIWIYLRGE
jgi:hypothetical protein